ncbi:hypothetical protein NDU88_001723 [Pleurodeles waltl]|uniref:Uncharacterized protein n=1 Tax=Pleurodeles waltl TaxID=8319 RepID=A0AAV7U8R7_PLEWA|nr:hypothetical protein NDU88_001723 [Pleurodeles waltl]
MSASVTCHQQGLALGQKPKQRVGLEGRAPVASASCALFALCLASPAATVALPYMEFLRAHLPSPPALHLRYPRRPAAASPSHLPSGETMQIALVSFAVPAATSRTCSGVIGSVVLQNVQRYDDDVVVFLFYKDIQNTGISYNEKVKQILKPFSTLSHFDNIMLQSETARDSGVGEEIVSGGNV